MIENFIPLAAKVLTVITGLVGIGSIFNAVKVNKEKHGENDRANDHSSSAGSSPQTAKS